MAVQLDKQLWSGKNSKGETMLYPSALAKQAFSSEVWASSKPDIIIIVNAANAFNTRTVPDLFRWSKYDFPGIYV